MNCGVYVGTNAEATKATKELTEQFLALINSSGSDAVKMHAMTLLQMTVGTGPTTITGSHFVVNEDRYNEGFAAGLRRAEQNASIDEKDCADDE